MLALFCFLVFKMGFAGIMFQDITTLLLDHKVFKDTVDIFVDRYRDMDISAVAGIVLYFWDHLLIYSYFFVDKEKTHFVWFVKFN